MNKTTHSIRTWLWYWLPVIGIAAIIFFFSSRPALHTASDYATDFVIKKLAHFTEYAIFSIFVYRAISHTCSLPKTHCALLAVVFTIIYAISDEWHQSFVPGREPHVRDVLIDTTGGLFGVFISRVRRTTTG